MIWKEGYRAEELLTKDSRYVETRGEPGKSTFHAAADQSERKVWSRPDHQGCCRKLGFTEQTNKKNPGSNLTRKVSDEIWLDKSHSSCKMRDELERSAI